MKFKKNLTHEELMEMGKEISNSINDRDREELALMLAMEAATLQALEVPPVELIVDNRVLRYMETSDIKILTKKLHDLLLSFMDMQEELHKTLKNAEKNAEKNVNKNTDKEELMEELNKLMRELKND